MAKTISVMIYNNKTFKYETITNSIVSDITIDERLDEVLDSATFSFLSENFTTAIEPFTRVYIMFGSNGGFYFCSSTCNKYLTKEGLYYHEVQCYEPTKYLECLIVGTKAFSIIDGQSNYNSNYDRIRILCELMSNKYGVDIELDSKINSTNFSKEREYSFGAGSTLWDCLSEIMNTENAIPRLTFDDTASSINLNKFVLTCDFIKESTETAKSIQDITKLETTQSVDEYCSEMECELGEVIDRDTLQECYLTVRSQSDVICDDSACLIAPSNIESVESLGVKLLDSVGPYTVVGFRPMLVLKTKVDKILDYYKNNIGTLPTYNNYYEFPLIYNENGEFDNNGSTGSAATNWGILKAAYQVYLNQISSFVDSGLSVDDAKECTLYPDLIDWLNSNGLTIDSGGKIGTINEAAHASWYAKLRVYDCDVGASFSKTYFEQSISKFYLLVPFDQYHLNNLYYDGVYSKTEVKLETDSMNLTSIVLAKEQWDLLDETERPKYLYYQSGSNYIEGFNNYARDGFWESLIYGSVGPPLVEYAKESEILPNIAKTSADSINCYLSDLNKLTDGMTTNLYSGVVKWNSQIPFQYPEYNASSGNDQGMQIKPINALLSYDSILSTINNFTQNIYRLKYYTKSPAYLRTDKKSYECQLNTSRSYNNGASTIDYNLLVPGIQRAVDMQGLPITTIYSKSQTDIQIGTLTEYGYLISKQSTFRRIQGKNIETFVYNCCENIEQLAAAIGVSSQYEATNLPQTGIVDRFIYLTTTYDLEKEDLGYGLYFRITNSANENIMKPVQKLHVDGKNLYVCECVDNYCFDYQKKSTNVSNYYLKNAVPYADSNNYIGTISTCSFARWHSSVTPTLDYLNNLPYINGYWFTFSAWTNLQIYKDPRERLIFVIEKK